MPSAFSDALNYVQRQQSLNETIRSRQQLYMEQMQERQRMEAEREQFRQWMMQNSPAQQRANLLQQKYEQQQKLEEADRNALLELDPKNVPVDLRPQLEWAKGHPTADVVKRMFMMLGKFNPRYIPMDIPDPNYPDDPTKMRHIVIRTDIGGGVTGVTSSPGLSAGLSGTGGGRSPATSPAGGRVGTSPPGPPPAPPAVAPPSTAPEPSSTGDSLLDKHLK